MKILVTGGAGYIGSHTLVELLASGHEVVVVDNLSNSHIQAIRNVERISNTKIDFCHFDLSDKKLLDAVFTLHAFDAVIHFAGLKAVGESVRDPILYYRNNLGSTTSLLETMRDHNVHNLVFSSSATVYGKPEFLPIREDAPLRAENPYGHTKLFIEQMLRDYCVAQKDSSVIALRYFNPVGAHPSGDIGEDPQGIPNNLLPYVAQVAVGKLAQVNVFGDDYDTPDGTGIRDYIHVCDLAKAHVAAINKIEAINGFSAYNVGTGNGISVLEVIKAFEAASGKTIPYTMVPRRQGDVAACYADPSAAEEALGWSTELTIQQACHDLWHWQNKHPAGFAS